MGAARTVAVPANATRRARPRCVSLIAAAWFGLVSLNVCVCLALSLNVANEQRVARTCGAFVPVLQLNAEQCRVKGIHGLHSWRIASSRSS